MHLRGLLLPDLHARRLIDSVGHPWTRTACGALLWGLLPKDVFRQKAPQVCADVRSQRSCAHEQPLPCLQGLSARRAAGSRCPSGRTAGAGRIRHRLRRGASLISLRRPVAVKIDSRPLHDERNRRRFMREMAAASRISGHPNAVSLIDSGVLPDGRPYLVMERCDGGSLAQVLERCELSAA